MALEMPTFVVLVIASIASSEGSWLILSSIFIFCIFYKNFKEMAQGLCNKFYQKGTQHVCSTNLFKH